jgi:phosphoribosylanthranilate isomerase
MTKAKICGLSTPESVEAALAGGATHLGFNFFPASPRYVTPELAAQLAEPARGRAKIVALMGDPGWPLIEAVVTALLPDFVQLHGDEKPYRISDVSRQSGRPIIKALSVSTAADIKDAQAYDGLVAHLLFDAKPPKDAALPGGNGVAFDWTLLDGVKFQQPYFLAGGLNPWNVAEAVKLSGAPMVDVSSGVERGPGLKDPALITEFLDAVRRT